MTDFSPESYDSQLTKIRERLSLMDCAQDVASTHAEEAKVPAPRVHWLGRLRERWATWSKRS